MSGFVGQFDLLKAFHLLHAIINTFFLIKPHRIRKLEEVAKHETLPPHPNCLHLVKAWEESGRLFIQTELCDMR